MIALSWKAIFIKNSEYNELPFTDLLIQDIKSKLAPPYCWTTPLFDGICKLQDPLLYKQQEVYRLGYLQ